MNWVATVILAVIVVELVLNLVADRLNLGCLQESVPPEFQDVYPPLKYQKSQTYLKTTTRFGWLATGVDLLLFLGFWFGRGFVWLDLWVTSLNHGPVLSGILYIGVLMLLKTLSSLPFAVYRTFGIEARFGFNRTTVRTFFLDRLKGLALGIIIGGPLLAGVLSFFVYAGNWAWLYCWGILVGGSLILQYVAPTWIMPLFNKFTPLADGALKQAIFNYARNIGFSLQQVFVMDGSKRSAKSNAFFTGFGRNKRIVLFDTLIEKQRTDELLAVLAHEMGHYKLRHIQVGMLLGMIQTGVLCYLLSLFISAPPLFEAFFIQTPSVHAGLIFFGLLFSAADLIIGIAMQAFSRHNEYAADRFAVQTTASGRPLIQALKKLSVDNLSNLTPHPFYVFLNYSHPPLLQRIEAIQTAATK